MIQHTFSFFATPSSSFATAHAEVMIRALGSVAQFYSAFLLSGALAVLDAVPLKIFPDQLTHDLRRRQILCSAQFLERLLLVWINQHGQACRFGLDEHIGYVPFEISRLKSVMARSAAAATTL